jgi:hypothetical protein
LTALGADFATDEGIFMTKPDAKKEKAKTEEAEKKHLDDELNKALKDTFPGSDPPAVVQPPHSHHDKDTV